MLKEESNVIEYNVDYRDNTTKPIKSETITKTKLKQKSTTEIPDIKSFDKNISTRKKTNSSIKIISEPHKKSSNNYNEYPKIKIISHKDEREETQRGYISTTKKTKKQIGLYQILFACVTMILSFTGIIILLSAMNRTTSVINDSPTFSKYNNYIAPVVMHNPEQFNETEKANTDTVISSSIWRTILQNGIENYKELDDQGLILIPVNDIQNACTDLFGPNYNINTTENIYGPFYSYIEGESSFHISAISNLGTYVPYIDEITEEDDCLSLKVSYLSRDDKYLSTDKDKPESPTPVKQMKYKLKINDTTNKYYIYAIENL